MSEHYPEGPFHNGAQNKFMKRMYRECLDCKHYIINAVCNIGEDVMTSKVCGKYAEKDRYTV